MSVSVQNFLQFLRLSCQMHESINKNIDNKINNSNNFKIIIKNELIQSLAVLRSENVKIGNCEKPIQNTSDLISTKSPYESQHKQSADHILAGHLSYVINEGLLDSILPYIYAISGPLQSNIKGIIQHICGSKSKLNSLQPKLLSPKVQNTPTNDNIPNIKTPSDPNANAPANRQSRKKLTQFSDHLSNYEILIHVCDEVKGISKDFMCPQKLLVVKMGYFSDVTAGQRLEDMDISVHCDLQIFEWLMRWVKKDTLSEELWPFLDSSNVIPILVSAGFLLMEPLVVDCLAHCHAYLNEIVKASANLSCLNDSMISRLAAMFTNLELEMVKDKRERVTPRLWIKLIQSLCEPEPQALRGHYGSLCDLIRCDRCLAYVNDSMATIIHCHPSTMYLNRFGQHISQHNRNMSWSLSSFIIYLYKELRSWRKVYWRLWGNCHYLYCVTCETYFPLYQMNWCLYHPEQAQFLGPVTESRMPGPAGRFTCCGQQAFRYETLPGPMGCQYREHTVQIFGEKDRAILKLAQVAGDGDCLYEAAPQKPLKTRDVNEPWWNGIILTPVRKGRSLLPPIVLDDTHGRNYFKISTPSSISIDSSSETESSDNYRNNKLLKQFSTTSSDGCESDYSTPRQLKPRLKQANMRKTKSSGRIWSGEISARSNQDNQRDFEERAMKQILCIVHKKVGATNLRDNENQSNGGVYLYLEAEWREKNRQNKSKLTNK